MFILRKITREVDLLISGVDGFICDMCAQQAYDIVQEDKEAILPPLTWIISKSKNR